MSLPKAAQQQYRAFSRQVTSFALNHAIPIVVAPRLTTVAIHLPDGSRARFTLPQTLGKIDGATGYVLQLEFGMFVVTADHVLQEYEDRTSAGELLNWQVGKLPPFDPLSRVAWRGNLKRYPKGKDVVFLEVSEREAQDACAGVTNILTASTGWPPAAPALGDAILLAGYPNALREICSSTIEPGAISAMFRVTTSTGDGTFKCRFEYGELLSFTEKELPMKELNTNVGGLSGGPALAVGNLSYPVVGVITQRSGAFDTSDTIVVEALDGVPSRFSA
jgi:hypothetical protein